MSYDPPDFLEALDELESAEDFLNFFQVPFDQGIVHVNRLHILQRYHNYLTAHRERAGNPGYPDYKALLTQAYEDFVHSDAYTEKVMRVHQKASGIATVSVSSIKRQLHPPEVVMLNATWDFGDAVRVTRNVRNDGTYPGAATGDLLVRRDSVGHVVDIGTFLQDQVIYSVHFLDINRIVGCREEELIGADDPWVPSRYEVRERVLANKALVANGEELVPVGALGEVMQVIRSSDPPTYHLHFECQPGRIFAVPEAALNPLPGKRVDP